MSGNEEDYDTGAKYDIVELPKFDGGVVNSTEGLTSFSRSQKSSDHEQLTDVEEIRIRGDKNLRRKRLKKSLKAKGAFLCVNVDEEDVLTENEELNLSDSQIGRIIDTREVNVGACNQDFIATDSEEFSGDEHTFKNSISEINSHIFQQESFFSTIISTDSGQDKLDPLQGNSKISTSIKTGEVQESSADICVTDIEDLEQTDGDDLLVIDSQSRGTTPNLLRSVFDESAASCIHDQSKSEFDISNEAEHIKGFEDIRESHTDIECIE